jgi:hypothetical protein
LITFLLPGIAASIEMYLLLLLLLLCIYSLSLSLWSYICSFSSKVLTKTLKITLPYNWRMWSVQTLLHVPSTVAFCM